MNPKTFFLLATLMWTLPGVFSFGQGAAGLTCVAIVTQRGGDAEIYYTQPLPFEIEPVGWITSLGQLGEVRMRSGYAERHLKDRHSVLGQTRFWTIDNDPGGSFWLLAKGRRGGCVAKEAIREPLSGTARVASLITREDVIGGEGTGAELIPPDIPCEDHEHLNQILPATCPLLASGRLLYGIDSSINPAVLENPDEDYLGGCWDPINNPPRLNLWPEGTTDLFDAENVLTIEKATFTFDWEDQDIRIAAGETEGSYLFDLFGGIGGAYANFHYSVMPYDPRHEEKYHQFLDALSSLRGNHSAREIAVEASDLMRCAPTPTDPSYCNPSRTAGYEAMQYLLHLGDHTLDMIDRGNEAPSLQYHSLLPGGFFNKKTDWGEQCEVLDTRYQAPRQELRYRHFGIWDWDAHPGGSDSPDGPCVSIILWEGDSSWGDGGNIVRNDLDLESHVHLDDFVGYFKVCRNQTTGKSGYLVDNFSRGLALRFQTGSSACN